MASVIVTIDTAKDPAEYYKAGQLNADGIRLTNLIKGLNSGKLLGSVYVQGSATSPAFASGTATCASVTTQTITIGKTTLTAGTDWTVGASNTTCATALAAAINAHATLSTIVYATSSAAVVTITALQAGLLGNYIALASSGAQISVSGSYLAGGTGGAGTVAEKIV